MRLQLNLLNTNIGSNLAQEFTDEYLILPDNIKESLFLIPTTESEILKIIKSLKDKNGGVHKIHDIVLHLIAAYISTPLCYIINECIDKGIWLKRLKTAEIKQIFKIGIALFTKSLLKAEELKMHFLN